MIKNLTYKTKGTCSRAINITIDNEVIESVQFESGCPGNLEGISRLVQGMQIEDVISRLEGIRCGHRDTSCPDQLVKALIQMKIGEEEAISCLV